MTDKQIIDPCMGCSALECWGVVDCDVAQRVLALHKTLTEIKEIAKPFCEECKEFGSMPNERYCMYCNYNKILQKISEVENDNA